jgi:hypothetical protein
MAIQFTYTSTDIKMNTIKLLLPLSIQTVTQNTRTVKVKVNTGSIVKIFKRYVFIVSLFKSPYISDALHVTTFVYMYYYCVLYVVVGGSYEWSQKMFL